MKKTSQKPIRHEEGKNALPKREHCGCSIDMTLSVIGGKWKAPILWHLLEADGPMRFAALKRAIPAITQRMLARQLREMESHGIVYRDVYPVVPPRVEYGITKTGKTLLPVLDAMASWADKQGK